MNPPFKIVKNAVPKDHADFLYEYINIRCEATKYLYKEKLVKEHPKNFPLFHGTFDDDPKTLGSYMLYGDPAFDLLMMNLLEKVISESGENLMPMVTYARIYTKGHELSVERRTGRGPENITAAIHLGSEGSSKIWPSYIQSPEGETFKTELGVGDMVLYGGECKHSREACEHDYYGQVMLHYTKQGFLAPDNKPFKVLDGRRALGIPKTEWLK